jgi:hypothetical protein
VEYSNFALNVSRPTLPQLQMVVQELKTKFEHGKFLGAISIVFKDCRDINFDYDDAVASFTYRCRFLSGAASPLIKVFIKKNTKKRYGNSGNSLCAEFGDKVKAKSLLAGEVAILNQNILMISQKCIKRAI